MSRATKILVVDDTTSNIELLNELLSAEGYSISGVPSGKLALKVIPEFEPDLILLDIMMPEMDGYQVAKHLKSDESTQDIPIVFITAKSEPEDIEKGFIHGAVDYITKPIRAAEVLARVKNQVKISGFKRKQDHFVSQLSVQENRYRAILESAKDPMLTLIPPGKISWINPAAERLFESPDYELSGRKLVEFLIGSDEANYEAFFNQHLFELTEANYIQEGKRYAVKFKPKESNVMDVEIVLTKVMLSYPLYLCHFHLPD